MRQWWGTDSFFLMSLCILTNDSALFSFASAESMQHLRSMPLTANELTISAPIEADFEHVYNQAEIKFKTLLVLCPAPELLTGLEAAQSAANKHGGKLKISVLNTGQIGPGLGMLAQLAARQAAAGAGLSEVEDTVRSAIPYIFTLLCPGKNPQEKVVVTNETANQPIFSLENGMLAPYKKVRTRRHIIEDLQEFLEEFEKPQQISLFHGSSSKIRPQSLREATTRLFPGILLNDLPLNLHLTALFGSQTVGLTVLEMPQKPQNRD